MIDDNFECIVTATKWGRNVIDVIRKLVTFCMCTVVSFLWIIAVTIGTSDEFAFSAVKILFINLMQDPLAALALASEKPDSNILNKPPEDRNSKIFNAKMWRQVCASFLYQAILMTYLIFFLSYWIDDTLYPYRTDTFIFCTFLWINILNILICRVVLNDSWNIFKGLTNNVLFLFVFAIEVASIFVITEFGG